MLRRYLRIPDEGARQPASRVAHPAEISESLLRCGLAPGFEAITVIARRLVDDD